MANKPHCKLAVAIMNAVGISEPERPLWWKMHFEWVREKVKKKRDSVQTRIKEVFISKLCTIDSRLCFV